MNLKKKRNKPGDYKMKPFSKRYNKCNGLFDYIDLDVGLSGNNYYLTIIIFGVGFDYDSKNGGLKFVNQWNK